MSHVKWPSIESLRHVGVNSQYYGSPTVTYRGKIKLHGTNAAVRHENDGLFAQSRSTDLGPGNTNSGFYTWVDSQRDRLLEAIPKGKAVFGEWCGSGIQSSTSINQIGKKVFAIFGIVDIESADTEKKIIYDPAEINKLIDVVLLPNDAYILPYDDNEVTIDFNRLGGESYASSVASILESRVAEVEKCDPWVKHMFKAEGPGEGYVMYPISSKPILPLEFLCVFEKFSFKIKGEKHKAKATKQKVEIAPEILVSVEEFINAFVTPVRLEQCVSEVGAQDGLPKHMGNIVKWMHADILKESVLELQESNLIWKDVSGQISTRIRELYLK